MSSDQNTAGVSRAVEELSEGKMGRADGPSDKGSQPPDAHYEVYTHGYSPRVEAFMAARTASQQAGFFLPHLRVGMHVLDCGCGPGSTTLDFAAAIAPGQVEGIDIGPTQIEAARARAVERRLTNVHFQVGTIYELPFAADSSPNACIDLCGVRSLLHFASARLSALPPSLPTARVRAPAARPHITADPTLPVLRRAALPGENLTAPVLRRPVPDTSVATAPPHGSGVTR